MSQQSPYQKRTVAPVVLNSIDAFGQFSIAIGFTALLLPNYKHQGQYTHNKHRWKDNLFEEYQLSKTMISKLHVEVLLHTSVAVNRCSSNGNNPPDAMPPVNATLTGPLQSFAIGVE